MLISVFVSVTGFMNAHFIFAYRVVSKPQNEKALTWKNF